jgi:hypothetical protein
MWVKHTSGLIQRRGKNVTVIEGIEADKREVGFVRVARADVLDE